MNLRDGAARLLHWTTGCVSFTGCKNRGDLPPNPSPELICARIGAAVGAGAGVGAAVGAGAGVGATFIN